MFGSAASLPLPVRMGSDDFGAGTERGDKWFMESVSRLAEDDMSGSHGLRTGDPKRKPAAALGPRTAQCGRLAIDSQRIRLKSAAASAASS